MKNSGFTSPYAVNKYRKQAMSVSVLHGYGDDVMFSPCSPTPECAVGKKDGHFPIETSHRKQDVPFHLAL